MLDNTITLPVDLLNSGVTTDVDFTRFDEYQNRTVYISENHDPGDRDLLTVYRTFPKVTGTFKGVRKTTVKFTKDVEVPTTDGGTTTSANIVEVNFSIPIGVADADITVLHQRVIALLDQTSLMLRLNSLQEV